MSKEDTATVTTSGDGGGANRVDVPESEFHDTRTNADGTREALVTTSYDGGGKNTEWVPINK